MWTYFFYGTLMDPDVSREVIGRPLSGFAPLPATLKSYERRYVVGATYPGIFAAAEASVRGLCVKRIAPLEASRISRFEGPMYDTSLKSIQLDSGEEIEARVFIPKPAIKPANRRWDLKTWQNREKKRFLNGMRRKVLV